MPCSTASIRPSSAPDLLAEALNLVLQADDRGVHSPHLAGHRLGEPADLAQVRGDLGQQAQHVELVRTSRRARGRGVSAGASRAHGAHPWRRCRYVIPPRRCRVYFPPRPGILPGVELRDRCVVVTGAASGIGRGLAERFADEGPRKLILADLDLEAVTGRRRADRPGRRARPHRCRRRGRDRRARRARPEPRPARSTCSAPTPGSAGPAAAPRRPTRSGSRSGGST